MRPAIRIDPMHNAAIREEVAEGLRLIIKRETNRLPLRFAALLTRFAEQDRESATRPSPSFVPTGDEVHDE